MKVTPQIQQDLWHPGGHIVREGLHTTSQAQDSGVTVDEGWGENESGEQCLVS